MVLIVNDDIARRLATLRARLDVRPDGVLVGDIPAGATAPASGDDTWDQVLALADGGRLGSVDLFSSANLARNQFVLADVLGGQETWLVIGQVLYQPLLLSRASHELSIRTADGELRALGPATAAINHYLLGSGYLELDPTFAEDDWWEFLRTAGPAGLAPAT